MIKLGRRVLRLSGYLIVNIIGMPIQLLAFKFAPHYLAAIPVRYHKICMKLFGVQVLVKGDIASAQPVLFVANHVSYLDIPILGSILPASFVAKQEVAGWPLFGWLAKLQRTVFVSRQPRDVGQQNNKIAARLAKGDNLIVFPEGTNTDGNRIAPFHTSVFQMAIDYALAKPLLVQPVSINCLALEGVTAGRCGRQIYSWYGPNNGVGSHLWNFMGFANAIVLVEFHPPLNPADFAGRKPLTQAAEALVRQGFSAVNRGVGMPAV